MEPDQTWILEATKRRRFINHIFKINDKRSKSIQFGLLRLPKHSIRSFAYYRFLRYKRQGSEPLSSFVPVPFLSMFREFYRRGWMDEKEFNQFVLSELYCNNTFYTLIYKLARGAYVSEGWIVRFEPSGRGIRLSRRKGERKVKTIASNP